MSGVLLPSAQLLRFAGFCRQCGRGGGVVACGQPVGWARLCLLSCFFSPSPLLSRTVVLLVDATGRGLPGGVVEKRVDGLRVRNCNFVGSVKGPRGGWAFETACGGFGGARQSELGSSRGGVAVMLIGPERMGAEQGERDFVESFVEKKKGKIERMATCNGKWAGWDTGKEPRKHSVSTTVPSGRSATRV